MKQPDKNEFFRQATIRICGSLEIEKSLKDCLPFFNAYMPVTGMYLLLFEPHVGTIRALAFAASDKNEKRYDQWPIPKAVRKQFESEWAAQKEVIVIGDAEAGVVTRHVSEIIPINDRSLLVLSLKLEEKRLGALAVYTEGLNQYSPKHAELIGLLNEPFAIAISNAIKHEEVLRFKDTLEDDNQYLHHELLKISGDEIIGASSGLKGVMEMVQQVSPLNSPVLLMGETGTGKEVIANTIHYASPRKNGPFIKVNCGAIPGDLIDSELFGHEEGAFTGAVNQKRGRFERAHKGTIFLDEIGDLPLNAQTRLLRVIQNGELERVGGTSSIKVDIRIISATHRDLQEMVKLGSFREDLWFRLNVFPIMIPPLRQRKEDLADLVAYFIQRKSREMKLNEVPHVHSQTIDQLKSYNFPGNVRELENMIERSLIQCQGTAVSIGLNFEKSLSNNHINRNVTTKTAGKSLLSLNEIDTIHIKQVLDYTSGRIAGENGAAKILGLHPNTLRSRMKKLGINVKRE